ncbi:TATA-box-binding protein-like protein [Leptotrombidium deliense]|uniref:TATA-box-binding protein-like protein n=1 Tax=Leptotrombidium deliense TaxID=299467 RepID=A0A443RZF2_9ACAR|nr:TATA-box-binding protein-like protein [Leptotrombidium deliense]
MMLTANLNCKIDLQKVENAYNNQTKYNPNKFCGLIFRICAPKCTVTIHSTGSVIVLGVKSKKAGIRVIQKVCKYLERIDYKASITDVNVKTVTYAGVLPFNVNLNEVSMHFSKRCSYHPELFNGLRLKIPKTNGVMSIFHTGSFYVTGIKQKCIVNRIVGEIINEIESIHGNGKPKLVDESLLRNDNSHVVDDSSIADCINIQGSGEYIL